jgi:hypothetical protein
MFAAHYVLSTALLLFLLLVCIDFCSNTAVLLFVAFTVTTAVCTLLTHCTLTDA